MSRDYSYMLGNKFAVGHISPTRKLIGTVVIRIGKNGVRKRWIKTDDPDTWMEYAKYIWQVNFGDIPKGLILHYIDGNSLNDDLRNYALVTRTAYIRMLAVGVAEDQNQKKLELRF